MPKITVDAPDNRAPALPRVFQRYRSQIDVALRASLEGRNVPVYDVLRYSLGWADVDGNPRDGTVGKGLRPTLCLCACEATGGEARTALPAGVALELIHNFSLIHDDIQDRDDVRHNMPTVWALWGDSKALVAGDTLRVIADTALQSLVEEGVSLEQTLNVGGLLAEAYLEMIEGQYLDMAYEGRHDITISQYLAMVSRKTGALIRCAMKIGAVIGTTDPASIRALGDCGLSLGLVFQIRDDLLGVWGDQDAIGKPVGADIRRKKNSLPVVWAMSRATGADKKLLAEIYDRETLSEEDVALVLEIMDNVKAGECTQSLAAEHCERALERLSSVEMAPESRRDIEEIAHFLLVREH